MMKRKRIITLITTIVLAFLMITSLSFVFPNSATTIVKAQTATSTIPSDLLQYDWMGPRSTPEGTFASAGPGPTSPSILWKTDIPDVGGAMAAFNGLVFTADAFGTSYALNASTGAIVWKYAPTSPAGLMGNTPVKLDNTYMLLGGSCVYIANGTLVWTAPAGFEVADDLNGVGYVPSIGMYLAGDTGWSLSNPSQPPTLAWNITSTNDMSGGTLQMSCVYGNGTLFIGGNDGYLRAYGAKNGTLLWSTPGSSAFMYGMTYDNGMVFDGGLDNNMRAWNATTGQLIWTYNPGTWYGMWASSSGAAYGMVYEHNQDTYLYAINETNGKLVWRAEGPGIGYSDELAIAGGYVYCQMGDNEYRNPSTGVYGNSSYDCYNAYTGQLIWSLPVEDGAPFNIQCIAYGNLYMCPTTNAGIPGEWSYSILGAGSIGQVWCISSTPSDWPMFMADPTHSSEGDGPTNLTLSWAFNTGAEVVAPSTLVNGICYVGSTNGNIYALGASNGTELWSFQTGYEVRSEVAVVNGMLYTGADSGNIYCLNAATGAKIWETPAGGITISLLGGGAIPPIRSSPEVVNGNVYVGSLDGNLYCLNANTGAVLWKYQTGGQILATPAIDNTGVYVPSNTAGDNGTFYKLDLSGNVLWNDSIPYLSSLSIAMGNIGGLYASPTLASDLGMVFLRNCFITNYGINSTTGQVVWTYNSTTNVVGTSFQAGGVPQPCAPLYSYGALYINNYYDISCLNALTGTLVWSTYLSREDISQGISGSYGLIYSVNEAGNVYVLNAQTGAKISYYTTGCDMHAMPTLYNGSLYVGTNDWDVLCLSNAVVTLTTTTPTPTPTPTPTHAVTPTPTATSPSSTLTSLQYAYIGIVVVIIIVIIAVVAVLLRKRKKSKQQKK
jgi:outer membrane protein assembly factor BamB